MESLLTVGQRYVLDQLVEVSSGAHVSDLERWRKGPPRRASGPSMVKALDQVAEIMGLELASMSVDDTLKLLDLLMSTELLNKASTAADKEKVRKHPKLTRATARLAVAAEALLDAEEWGSEEEISVAEVWEAIEAVVSRAEVRAAVATVNEMAPPPDAEAEADDWRAELVGRFATVSGSSSSSPL